MKVKLESFLRELREKTTENNQYPVLTSSKAGLYLQSDYFNKQVASKDNTGYKIIRRGQFTYRAMSDTGEFFPNMLECADIGIVSPAYPVFEIMQPEIIIPEFLKYFFKSDSFQFSIASFAQGSTRTSVKFDKMKTVSINLPSIAEQRLIVEVLDRAKAVVAGREQELQKLDELIKARFVEMFGDAYSNPRGLPVLEWNDVFNTTTVKLDSNAATENGAYPFFTCSKEALRIDKYAFDQEALLLAGNNAAGKYDVKHYNGKFNAYQRTYVLSLKQEWSYALFKYQLEDKLVYLQQQSLGGLTKYLTMKILGNLTFLLPSMNEQKQFEDFVKQVDKSKVVGQFA